MKPLLETYGSWDTVREWRTTSLGDVVRLQRGHDLPEGNRRAGEIPVMGSFGVTGWHNEARAKGPGVTVGRSGASIGVVSFVDNDYWPLNTCLYVTDFLGNDPKFCYYWLKTLDLAAYNSGSAQPSLNRNYIYGMSVSIPADLDEQRAIARILGTLDDKIELNRRMTETLEAMARAIFKSWFIDFDPVRRNIARRTGQNQPSSDASHYPLPLGEGQGEGGIEHLDALFPDRLEDSELGEIPAGWEIGLLEDVLTLQRGFDLPTSVRRPGPYPVIAASGPNGSHDEFMVRGPGVTTGRSGVLGNVFYVHDDFWPLNTSLWVKEFKRSTAAYAFYLLRRLDFTLFNAGSAVPTLNRNHVHNLPTLMPPNDLIHAFDAVAVPLLKRQRINAYESCALTALRDALLPKLIGGEVRVKNAEWIVAGANV